MEKPKKSLRMCKKMHRWCIYSDEVGKVEKFCAGDLCTNTVKDHKTKTDWSPLIHFGVRILLILVLVALLVFATLGIATLIA